MDWVHKVSRKETAALQKGLTGMELPLKEWLPQYHSWSLQPDVQRKHTDWIKNSYCWWGKKSMMILVSWHMKVKLLSFPSLQSRCISLPSRGSALFCFHSPLRISSIPSHQFLLLLKLPDTNQSWSNLLHSFEDAFLSTARRSICVLKTCIFFPPVSNMNFANKAPLV